MAHAAEEGTRKRTYQLETLRAARRQLQRRLKPGCGPGLRHAPPATTTASGRTDRIVQGTEEGFIAHLGAQLLRIIEHPFALVKPRGWCGRMQPGGKLGVA